MEATLSTVAGLLATLSKTPSYAEVQRVGGQLLELGQPPTGWASAATIRIGIVSSFTAAPLAPPLAVECHRLGIWPSVYVGGYGQFRQEVLDRDSELYRGEPDIVFLIAELEAVVPVEDDSRAPAAIVNRAVAELVTLVDAFKSRSQALLVLFDFNVPVRFPFSIGTDPSGVLHQEVNAKLREALAGDPQVRIFAYDALCAHHGKERSSNAKMRRLGDIRISDSLLPAVARKCAGYVRALKGIVAKCLVLDLDGTLWGGTVGEDGPHGVRLQDRGSGSEYYEFQRAIAELRRRGVLLAVNSQNHIEDVRPILRDHPYCVLREASFAAVRVNWLDKAVNLRSIAEELDLGLDSLVYLDDDAVQRAWIRRALPEVAVYDLPDDPAEYVAFLWELVDFESLTVTNEDRARASLYADARKRKDLAATAPSREDFIASLCVHLVIGRMTEREIGRVAQLTRKTNQFNLTTRRYSDAEIAALMRRPNMLIYTLEVADVFGHCGLVGVIIIEVRDDRAAIDTCLLSCRALGLRIEHVFLGEVAEDVKRVGVKTLTGEYLPNNRNSAAATFFESCHFQQAGESCLGRSRWMLSLVQWHHDRSALHRVTWRNEDDRGQCL